MTPSWSDHYIGIAYRAQGRERATGLDCWGLVRLVHAEQFGTELPSLAGAYDASERERTAELIAARREGWKVADVPRAGDVALFRVLGQDSHVGVITRPGYFLHVREGGSACVERLDASAWKHRLSGIYRYAQGASALDVVARPHPLHTLRIDAQMRAGMTLAEMARQVREHAGVAPEAPCTAVIAVDGVYVPQKDWATCAPAPGSRVEYRATASGSGMGRMLGMLAIMAVAMVAAPYLVGAMGGTMATATTAGVGLAGLSYTASVGIVSAGINMVGGLLLNAIFPVRPAASPAMPSTPASMAMLQGGANSASKYGAIPVVLGRYRYTAPLGAEIYTEATESANYLRMILVWGYGPLQVSDIVIGSTPISSYDEVEIETVPGLSASEVSDDHFANIYSADVEQLSVGVKLKQADGWLERALEGEATKITVVLNFPAGLWEGPASGENAGQQSASTCEGEVQVRKAGEADWMDISNAIRAYSATLGGASTNFDADAYFEPIFQWTRITIDSSNVVRRHAGSFTDDKDAEPSYALQGQLQGFSFALPGNFQRLPAIPAGATLLWDVCVYANAIVEVIDRRPAAITGCALTYSGLRITVAAGAMARTGETFSITKNTRDAFSKPVHFNVPRGIYEVRVRRTDSDATEHTDANGNKTMWSHDCYVASITGYCNRRPIAPPKPLAMSAIRIKATNQLNGSLEGIMATVTSMCWDVVGGLGVQHEHMGGYTAYYVSRKHHLQVGDAVQVVGTSSALFNGIFSVTGVGYTEGYGYYVVTDNAATLTGTTASGGYLWSRRATRNPASLLRYVLQHPGNAKRVPDSQIDLASLADWHNFCRSNGFMFDSVMTSQQALFDVLRDISAAGRASPTLIDGKWTVVIDRPRSEIAQHFTPHNSWGFEGTRALPVLPDGFRVNFANAERGYQADELLVYNDGFSRDNARLFESLSLPGVTSAKIAYKHARFHLAQLKLRPETYTLNADIEHLICMRGDLVKVTHDVPMWGLGSARISQRISAVVLQLDEELGMQAGKLYTLRIRQSDGASLTRTVAAVAADGYYRELTLTVGLSEAQAEPGALVLFGELGQESVDLVVQSIEPAENMSARLTLVDYSPAIYDSDTEAVPAFDSQITLPPTLLQTVVTQKPTVVRVVSDESAMKRIAPGKYIYGLRVSFTGPASLPKAVTHVQGQIDFAADDTNDWQTETLVPVKLGSITFESVQEGSAYRFRLRYVDAAGRAGPWSAVQTHTVAGRINPPATVTGLKATVSGASLLLDWADNKEPDVTRYEVRSVNAGWGTADAGRVYFGGSSSCSFKPGAPGVYTFYAKARDDAGNWSALAASVTFTALAPPAPGSAVQDIIKVASGKINLSLDWPAPPATSFAIAGYEVRAANSDWGAAGYRYRGAASLCQLTSLPATASTTLHIKSFDALGNYSATALMVVHDVTAPASLATATLALARVRSTLSMTLGALPARPADFDCYEFRIGQVRAGATGGDDTPDAVVAGTTDNVWSDPDCQVVRSATPSASIALAKFAAPLYSAAGVTYRVACRMRDKSDNYSPASATSSITITKIA